MSGEHAFDEAWLIAKAKTNVAHSKESWDRANARNIADVFMENYGENQAPLRDDIAAMVEYAGVGGSEEGYRRAGIETLSSVDNWKEALLANAAFNTDMDTEHTVLDLMGEEAGMPHARAKRYADLADGKHILYHASPFCQELSGARSSKKENQVASMQHMGGIQDTANELRRLVGKDNVSVVVEQSPNVKKPYLNPKDENLAAQRRGEWKAPDKWFRAAMGMPNLAAADFGAPQTRRRAFFGTGWDSPKPTSKKRSIDDLMPWLKDDWEDASEARADRINLLSSKGQLGSEARDFLMNTPTLADGGTWMPGNRGATWPEGLTRDKKTWADPVNIGGRMVRPKGGKISRSLYHLKPLDETGWSQTHHPLALTDDRFLTVAERLLYNTMDPRRDMSMVGDMNNPQDKNIGTMVGNVVAPVVTAATGQKVLDRLDNSLRRWTGR